MHVVGLDIGGTKCAVMLCKVNRESIDWYDRIEIPTTSDWREILESLCCHGEGMIAKFKIKLSDCRIGISCGGPLSFDRMHICSPPNLPGWNQVPVVDYVSNRLHMPANMLNDADACALAEWKYGAGRGTSHMVFLTFGTGLGAGLILNGQLYTGAGGYAGEVGHIRMAPEGPVGYGKAGSLEGFCSGGGIRQLAIRQAELLEQQGKRASYQVGKKEDITTKDVALAARAGGEDAKEVFAESGRYFGRGLAILVDILNPDRIVAGSIYAKCRDLLEPFLQETLAMEALSNSAKRCKIEPALLGDQIGDYGAVMAAIYEIKGD